MTLPQGTTTLLIFTQKLKAYVKRDNEDPMVRVIKSCARAIKAQGGGANLLLKLHPSETVFDAQRYVNSASSEGLSIEHIRVLSGTLSPIEALSRSDIVVAAFSTTILDSMLLGKPTVAAPFVMSDQSLPLYEWMNELRGGLLVAKDEIDLEEKLAKLLSLNDYRAWQARLAKQTSWSFLNIDGAILRVVRLVKQYLSKRAT